jgi:hypothetical protein
MVQTESTLEGKSYPKDIRRIWNNKPLAKRRYFKRGIAQRSMITLERSNEKRP